jgi:hypothetical protein
MVASSLQIDVSQLNIIAEPTNEINMGSSGTICLIKKK